MRGYASSVQHRGCHPGPDSDQCWSLQLTSRLSELNSGGPVTRAPFAKAAPDRLWE